MKTWQKSGLLILTFSLAMGWATQGEAALIRVGGPRMVVTQAQPITVIIIDSNGNTFEQTAYYDPSIGGINIDTSWAGPNTSIYIPALGVSYLWYNGYWVDGDGYYWDGTHRVYVTDPRWRERWTTYWHEHRHDRRDGQRHRREDWREKAQDWRDKRDEWREKVQDWRDKRDDRRQDWHDRQDSFDKSNRWDRQAGVGRSGDFKSGRADNIRSERSSKGQADSKRGDNPRSER